MPNVNVWLSDSNKAGDWLEDIDGDYRVWHMIGRFIADKPTSIIVYRGSTILAAQTVRLEQTRIQPDVNVGPGAREPRTNAILFGYAGHPTIADTNIIAGDKFVADGHKFEVRVVFTNTPGMLEAWLEQTG